ncbi:Crp/Fnr family transcriptional regulator [Scandinavium sp. SGZ-S8]
MLRDVARPGGTLLYQQEQQDQGFWYLLAGVIGLYHSLNNGKEVLVRVYQGEGWFGFTGLFGKSRYHCHARVMQEARLCHIVPHHPPTFLQHYPAFRQYLLEQMANSLADAEHRMTWIARHRSRERVLSSLWYLTQYFPGYDWTWREVAEFAGCETETALRFSKELRQASILDDSQRRLHVLHPVQLLALLDNSIIAPQQ